MNKTNKTKRAVLGAAGSAVVLGGLYALALQTPVRGSRSAADSGRTMAATATQAAAAGQARARATSEAAAQSSTQSVPAGEQAASDPQLGDPEQIAIANARRPIEEQSPEIQQRYYQGWLTGLRHAQALQRSSLLQLERQQQDANDSQTRTLIEQQIAQQRKLIEERTDQIARYESKVTPTGP